MTQQERIFELLARALTAPNPPTGSQVDVLLAELVQVWPADQAGVVLRAHTDRQQFGNKLSTDDLERINPCPTEVSMRQWAERHLILVPLPTLIVGRDSFLWLIVCDPSSFDGPLVRLVAATLTSHLRLPPTRTALAETLDQRLDDLGRVAGRIAHDFDNILTGVLGFADLALSHLPEQHPAASYINDALRVAQRGLLITQQMYQFSKAGTLHPPGASLEIALRNQQNRLKEMIQGKYRFIVGIPTDLPKLALDDERLEQVLTQLLNNALEATPLSGTIWVSATLADLDQSDCLTFLGSARPGQFVLVSISDTGSGISADVRKRLFVEPFFSTKTRRRGLGLVTAYRVLTAHGGGIRIEPQSEVGTRVTLAIPTLSTC